MFGWFRELLEIRYEFKERRERMELDKHQCPTCEVLRVELDRTNREKAQLLRELLKETDNPPTVASEPEPIRSTFKPWKLRQQELEAADRLKAAEKRVELDTTLRFNKNLSQAKVEQLEKEMGMSDAPREKEGI